MKAWLFSLPLLFALVLCARVGQASSSLPQTVEDHFQNSAAVCRGTVQHTEAFRDGPHGLIHTRALVKVDEVFKGGFPAVVQVIHAGGSLDGEGLMDGLNPQLRVGEERLFFLGRRENGTLYSLAGGPTAPLLGRTSPSGGKSAPFIVPHTALLLQLRGLSSLNAAGADVTDQAGLLSASALVAYTGAPPPGVGPTNGLFLDTNGYPARYITPDTGEPLGYLVDAQFLPASISTNQASNAIASALTAWGAVTGIKFRFDGYVNFSNPPNASTNFDGSPRTDGRLRIQMHDTYGQVPGGSVLGVGGRGSSSSTNPWGLGGNVIGNEFNRTTRGYVTLEHTNTALGDTNDLAEILTHEFGHSFGLAHSSEATNEPSATLSNAIMYFRIHKGGRGATLGAYDGPVIQQAHPPTNTPPYTFARMMDIITTFSPTNFATLNLVTFLALDLQGSNGISIVTNNGTANGGTFTVTNLVLRYMPAAPFGDTGRLDPATNLSYERVDIRLSDGTNASPFVSARVLSYSIDGNPFPAGDGLPDNWMTTYFGSADPAAGPRRGPTNDFDGDGYNNLAEFHLGSNPTRGDSHLRILSLGTNFVTFQARPYELYDLQTTTNLSNWVRAAVPVVPTDSTGLFTNLTLTNLTKQFIRVIRVP